MGLLERIASLLGLRREDELKQSAETTRNLFVAGLRFQAAPGAAGLPPRRKPATSREKKATPYSAKA